MSQHPQEKRDKKANLRATHKTQEVSLKALHVKNFNQVSSSKATAFTAANAQLRHNRFCLQLLPCRR